MSPDVPAAMPATPLARLGRGLRAAWLLLRLEVKLLTGDRLLLVVLAELAWLATIGVIQLVSDDKYAAESFYNRTVLLPGLLPAIGLGMAAVMAERDVRHLEMTLVSPGGRYATWAFRFAALAATCLASTLTCALLTWAIIEHDLPPIQSALHAAVPLVFLGLLTVFLSLLFNGAATAGLVTAGVVALSGLFVHTIAVETAGLEVPNLTFARADLFLNPLATPEHLSDPEAWFRVLVFNRGLLLTLTGLLVAGSLGLLQRRERLL